VSVAGDTGLPAERTRLAWRRTALAGTVVALLAARLAAVRVPGPAGLALTALAVSGWLGVLAVAFRRLRAMGPGRPAPVGRVLGLATLTVGYAALGTVLVFAGAPG
jgi:hypothetical protein